MGISKQILLNSMEFSEIFAQLHINKLIKLHKLVKLPDIPSFLSWLSLGYRVKVTAPLIRILTAGLSAAAEPLQSLLCQYNPSFDQRIFMECFENVHFTRTPSRASVGET